MAIVSISRIQIRRGKKNAGSGLPQLAGGEFGWAVDSQELYLGNGSVSEGAPNVGNTKVLTEHDNLFQLSNQYIYLNGSTVQTGTTALNHTKRDLQSRLDDLVSARSFGITGDGTDVTDALQRAHNFYKDLNEQGKKSIEINKKGLFRYYGDKIGIPKISDIKGKIDSFGKKPEETRFGQVKRLGKGLLGLPGGATKKVFQGLGGFLKKVGSFAELGKKFLKPALIYGGVILLGLMLVLKWLVKAGPHVMEMFSNFIPAIKMFFEGIWNILKGLFNIIAGIWKGDFGQIWKGLSQIIEGAVQVLIGGLISLVGIVTTLLYGIWAGVIQMVYDALANLWSKLPSWFPGKAAGGVTHGGVNLVGEKGPELVKLPAGSRVISNANSRGMGGNTINVHVNGRVGASDAEIRDIANKVAREINIRMNRQGTTMMGG